MTPRQRPTLALLTDYLVSNYQAQLLRAVEEATARRDVNLLTFVGRSLESPEAADRTHTKLYELVNSGNADGIIVVSGCVSNYCGAEWMRSYCARYAPVPVCSVGVHLPGFPSLVVGNRGGVRKLVNHLIDQHDRKRIAFIAGPEASTESTDRYHGYLDALEAHGIRLDDRFLVRGEFSVPTGLVATRELFARGVDFDAIVGANDYMALAARDILRERGLRVPEDVLVAGFDDAPFARFALPSLTTVRQPLRRLGEAAVATLLEAIEGRVPAELRSFEAEVVIRQSCGCGVSPRPKRGPLAQHGSREDTCRAIAARRSQLMKRLEDTVGVPPDALRDWAARLVDALADELGGAPHRFAQALAALLEEAQDSPDYLDEMVKLVSVLREEVYKTDPPCSVALELEQLWHEGQQALGNAATNAQGRTKLDLQVVMDVVRTRFERIATALTHSTLEQAVRAALPDVQIRSAFLGFISQDESELQPFVVTTGHGGEAELTRPFPASQLVPNGFFPTTRHSHVVLPLSFEMDWYGIAVLEFATNESVFGLLRDQVSNALKGGALYKSSLEESARREALEREQLHAETQIAARIQTKVLPRRLSLAGLELAARMEPAAQIGGDYYDVIACRDGGWIAIGDVTGHGLLAGLIMLMLQGMLAALTRKAPDADPAELFTALNAALYDNIRERLEMDDYATLCILRYRESGELRFAGAHEQLIIYRRDSKKCEIVEASGVWAGVVPDVGGLTESHSAKLSEGDVLVLCSDGIVEAMNERKEMLGLARLVRLVESHGTDPSQQIADGIVNAVREWQSTQTDDITLVVARYRPEA